MQCLDDLMITTHVKVVAKKKRLQVLFLVLTVKKLLLWHWITLLQMMCSCWALWKIAYSMRKLGGKIWVWTMHENKILSQRTGVEVRVEGLIVIGNLMIDQKQVIHLSW